MEAPHVQQLGEGSVPPMSGARAAQVDDRNILDGTSTSLDYASLSNPFPDTRPDPMFESFMYGNSGP